MAKARLTPSECYGLTAMLLCTWYTVYMMSFVVTLQVANEAPADIKSNLTRAWANFDQNKIESCNKPTEYKACLFSLCWFHSIVLGKRVGSVSL